MEEGDGKGRKRMERIEKGKDEKGGEREREK